MKTRAYLSWWSPRPRHLLTVITLFVGLSAHVKTHGTAHQARFGLGYTNNANFESSNQDSDIFSAISWQSSWTLSKTELSASLGYKDFVRESQNDALNWQLESTVPVQASKNFFASWIAALGGQKYTGKSPAQTEESFDFFYIDNSLWLEKDFTSQVSILGSPGLEVRRYPDFSNRTDTILYAEASLDWALPSKQYFSPSLGLGSVLSTDSLYRRRYVDIGFEWGHRMISSSLKASATLNLRSTVFPSRTVSQPTAVSRGTRRTLTLNSDSMETHSLIQLSASLTKTFGEVQWANRFSWVSQSSKSGIEDYKEASIMSSISISF